MSPSTVELLSYVLGLSGVVSAVLAAAYVVDRALYRAHLEKVERVAAGANAASPLYSKSSAAYGDYPFSAAPDMQLCGGCGETVPANSRPADHNCSALEQISLDLRV